MLSGKVLLAQLDATEARRRLGPGGSRRPFLELPLELARSIGVHPEARELSGTASRRARGDVDEWVSA